MTLITWMAVTLILWAGLGIIAYLRIRQDYHHTARLSTLGIILLLVVFSLQGHLLSLGLWGGAGPQAIPARPVQAFGLLLMLCGLGLCLAGMGAFRFGKKVIGRDVSGLVTKGIYRWTRNPQYAGYGLLQVGMLLVWWHPAALVGLAAYAVMAWLTVRLEETHLRRQFGEAFDAYCATTPRFIGLPRK